MKINKISLCKMCDTPLKNFEDDQQKILKVKCDACHSINLINRQNVNNKETSTLEFNLMDEEFDDDIFSNETLDLHIEENVDEMIW